ncbi:xylose isomerase-like protein [Armillaria novae-zelandiae]|uniref:Xylose isomerase-like protein n=1 Tax=Armillaria novae-zelandiae TaxID=153914 RepID=A0AA39UA87_9AGAR|nr:xylose isomerase-like protein [Armillaria novae-zelandiae]
MSTPVASLPVAVPTIYPVGRAWIPDLDVKIAEAKNAGFQGLEIFWEDLAAMLRATRHTKELCDTNGLVVMALQPFLNYDGIVNETKHQEHITKLKLWFRVAKILGTDLIQVPSQTFEKFGELGLKEDPPVRFAYEALAWGAHLDLWQQVWAVVTKVDLPNVGTVLDTYQILGRIYGDPTSATGKQIGAEEALAAPLKEMVVVAHALLPKLFYVQLSDAEHWWILMEVFSRTMSESGKEVPREHARRGMKSWKAFLTQLRYTTNEE